MFRTLIDAGFVNVARETIALSQLLSVASWHYENIRGNAYDVEHCRYSLVASGALQQRLTDVSTAISDEVITTVMVFAGCAVSS